MAHATSSVSKSARRSTPARPNEKTEFLAWLRRLRHLLMDTDKGTMDTIERLDKAIRWVTDWDGEPMMELPHGE